jgi:hypothetical protein
MKPVDVFAGLSMSHNQPSMPTGLHVEFDTTQDHPVVWRSWTEPTGLSCPEDECEHGWLPTDRKRPAGCRCEPPAWRPPVGELIPLARPARKRRKRAA